jgi:uncharacterized protein (DUF1697 family)
MVLKMQKATNTNTRKTEKYVAFLRGINVGGIMPIKMEDLRMSFESLGFLNVETLLASGNVLFEAAKTKSTVLTEKIEEKLKKTFNYEAGVILRTIGEIQELADLKQFENIPVTPQTRFYVTFLRDKPKNTSGIPYKLDQKDYKIVHISDKEAVSVLTLSPEKGTTDLMGFLEKKFGRNITTRNWNTIIKVLDR